MAKRSLDDAEIRQGIDATGTGVPASKKSRQENRHHVSGKAPDIVFKTAVAEKKEDAATKAERKEKKRLKKFKNSENVANMADRISTEESPSAGVVHKIRASHKTKGSGKESSQYLCDDIQLMTPENSAISTNQSTRNATPIETLNGQYIEDARLAALPQAEINRFLADNFITIVDSSSASTALRPITRFSYLPITDPAQRAPFKDFKAPTPIQAAAWPFLFASRDVIGVAETGSGKTMAFAVPCVRSLSSLHKSQKNKGPKALIVSPTRELAMQSYDQIKIMADISGLQAVCVYGGVAKDEQRRALKTADIVVATPGRLNDLVNEGSAVLSKAQYVVLDEADRMLDKGFEEDIRKIISQTMPLGKRQTLMFTATWPETVRSLASTFMSTPVRIAIGDNPEGDLRANNRIVQKVEVVDPRNKEYRLLQLLKEYQSGSQKDDRILVFALYKKEATRVEGFIRSKGFRVAGIHGDLSQEQRTKSLDAFKTGKTPILVATDVAARGLDIPAVKLVINCTFPLTVEDYVHRIGRTGRAGKDGLAITLFTEHDKAQSGALINVLKAANQAVPEELLKFGTTVKKKGHEAYGAFFKAVDTTKTAQKIKFD